MRSIGVAARLQPICSLRWRWLVLALPADDFYGAVQPVAVRGPAIETWTPGRLADTDGRRHVRPMVEQLIARDLDILGGAAVFAGTRVPVKTLTDYLEAGDPIDAFLDDFPSVSREQVIAFLEQAREQLIAAAE